MSETTAAVPSTPRRSTIDVDRREGLEFDRPPVSLSRLAWRRFRRHRVAMVSTVVLTVLVALCLAAPWIAPYGYAEQDLSATFSAPGPGHWLGTDSLGRDQLSRLLYGGRISLAVGFGVAVVAGTVGTAIGAVSGFAGGLADGVLMRLTDFMLALPALVVVIVAARNFGDDIVTIVLIVSSITWMGLARIVRGVTLSLRNQEFVLAARSVGAGPMRIVVRHVLPNTAGPIIVNLTLTVAAAILLESALSFLGLGIQPPTPTWGNMLAGSKGYVSTAPWLVWFPGLLILSTVLCVNFIGDGLRDALDPADVVSR